jgi:hypothetical protein
VVTGPHAQVGALGKVLAEQAVGVFVGAALPGSVRVTEIDLQSGRDLDPPGSVAPRSAIRPRPRTLVTCGA